MPVISATVSAWGLRSHTQQSIATVLGGKGSPCRSPFAPLCGMERRAPILHRRFCGTIRRPGLDFGLRGVLINTRCICSDRSWSPTAAGAAADQGHDRARQHNTQSIRVALMARISSEERTGWSAGLQSRSDTECYGAGGIELGRRHLTCPRRCGSPTTEFGLLSNPADELRALGFDRQRVLRRPL